MQSQVRLSSAEAKLLIIEDHKIMAKNISFTIKFWRQNGPKEKGHFDTHEMKNIPDDTSFLEMLDILNEELINEGKEPFVFDHDCREGICGMCSLYINGTPHGPFQRWRRDHCGALALGCLPRDQGLYGRPLCLR